MTLKNNLESNTIFLRLTMAVLVVGMMFVLHSCGISAQYSMTGVATTAKTISITEFYNNADLGPANMGQTISNQLKNYFIQNSSLSVVQENGDLQLEGEIVDFRLTPISPTATSDPNAINSATSTRLTITVKATYINTLDETKSFKDKSFSFYKDFDNSLNLTDVQEQFTKEIFNRIINDIFNASVANW
jgi:hypothetical protein